MSLNHETGYIWTALTPDIKPSVEGGGERRRVVGTRPVLAGGMWLFCSLFWNRARPQF